MVLQEGPHGLLYLERLIIDLGGPYVLVIFFRPYIPHQEIKPEHVGVLQHEVPVCPDPVKGHLGLEHLPVRLGLQTFHVLLDLLQLLLPSLDKTCWSLCPLLGLGRLEGLLYPCCDFVEVLYEIKVLHLGVGGYLEEVLYLLDESSH